jgi:hypothetical protein
MRRRQSAWHGPELTVDRAGTAMAHRRGLLGRRVLRAVGVVALLAGGLAGAVLVTVQVTRLRAEVAELEDRRECLLAHGANLEAAWAAASAPGVIRARAQDLDLFIPDEPDYVLLQTAPKPAGGAWQRLWARLGGDPTAVDPAAPRGFLAGAMVSLQPRAAHAATAVPEGR